MEVRQLEHFLAVAEQRSFTRAAQRLNYVQSALSVSIQSLERDLGVRLFDRTTHHVALTDAGEAVVPFARQTLASIEETRDVAAAMKGVLRGTLRVGIMQSFTFLDVADLLGRFHREHPEVEIQVKPSAGGSQALVEDLKHGDVDVAFVSVMQDPSGVSATELGVEDLYVVGTSQLLPPRRAMIELSVLADATFVDFPTGWGIRAAVDHAFAAADVRRRVTIEVADVSACLQLIGAGLGIALLPRSLLTDDDRLQTRRLASRLTWRVIMAEPSNRPIRAAAHAFTELVATARSNP
ncbi:MAG: LysR family transcriptional regulator [Solirubrobacteraceae bacterium]